MSDRPKRYTVIRIPTYLAWLSIVIFGGSVVLQASGQIARYLQPETDATLQCRQVVKDSIGWELSEGILCVRPVHFIREG